MESADGYWDGALIISYRSGNLFSVPSTAARIPRNGLHERIGQLCEHISTASIFDFIDHQLETWHINGTAVSSIYAGVGR
jgi:hypothetical protein